MSNRSALRSSLTNFQTIRNAGRRAAGSWGRAAKKLKKVANRATRRSAKKELKNHD